MLETSFNMIGEHASIKRIQAIVQKVAATDARVLVTGESGTGKELVARAIHNLSPNAGRPFVPVNCAAIPEALLESELFGHMRGAFTGAHASRPGLFQVAHQGTIFLDEVGELPLSLQAKLLRVLQDGVVRPLGAEHPVPVEVRVVAATNKELEHQVEKGSFREDLFFRLQVIPIHLPPLRARRSDIPVLVKHFLNRANKKHHLAVQITQQAMVYLWEYDWPGNIRELENMVERMVILADGNQADVQDLPGNIRSFVSDKKLPAPTSLLNDPMDMRDMREATEQFEHQLIEEALRLSNGNKSRAAKMLGLKRTTLVAKMRKRRVKKQKVFAKDTRELEETLSVYPATAESGKKR